jgi:hypothetical protein
MRKSILFFLTLTFIAACTPSESNILENDHVRFRFSTDNGALVSLYNNKENVEHLDSAQAASQPLWEFEYMPGVPAVENLPEAVSFRKKGKGCLEIFWKQADGAEGPQLKATIKIKKDRPSLADWHIEAKGLEGLGVKAIRFPLINGIRPLGE